MAAHFALNLLFILFDTHNCLRKNNCDNNIFQSYMGHAPLVAFRFIVPVCYKGDKW